MSTLRLQTQKCPLAMFPALPGKKRPSRSIMEATEKGTVTEESGYLAVIVYQ